MNSWLNTGGGGIYNRPAIPAGEIVRGRFFVALLKFGFSATGAEMLITDRYLILSPVDTGAARAILKALAGIAGVPGAKDLMTKVEQTGLTEPIQVSADFIQHIEPLGDGSVAAPPAVRITFANTGTIYLGVLHARLAANFDPRNRQARDTAVTWLRRLAASTSTAPLGAPTGSQSTLRAPRTNTSSVADTRDAWIRQNARLAAIRELRQWAELRDQGVLSEEEFEARKTALLKDL